MTLGQCFRHFQGAKKHNLSLMGQIEYIEPPALTPASRAESLFGTRSRRGQAFRLAARNSAAWNSVLKSLTKGYRPGRIRPASKENRGIQQRSALLNPPVSRLAGREWWRNGGYPRDLIPVVEPDGIEPTTSTMPLYQEHRKSNGLAGHKRAKVGTEKQ